ncbi:MAG: TM0996/MTH895 family glutaredoxin-like protein [Anaerolineaceae bacterium]|nr:TM0996/MTH895 family glutaredoxin-like protein [Anaerolineaceae bacterium]
MIIKVLGGGCPKCKRLEAETREVAEELGLAPEFIKVKEMAEIMAYDVMSTPALVIDEKVMCFGRIPEKSEIREWLEAAK